MKRRFFFYGTLTHLCDTPLTRAVLPLLGPPRRAFVRGRLAVIRNRAGCYPVLLPGCHGYVAGYVYPTRQGFGRQTLRLLDAYEDCDPRRPARSEYRRGAVCARLAGGGCVHAEAYLYNLPRHAGMRLVPRGDFVAFITARRLRVYGAPVA